MKPRGIDIVGSGGRAGRDAASLAAAKEARHVVVVSLA